MIERIVLELGPWSWWVLRPRAAGSRSHRARRLPRLDRRRRHPHRRPVAALWDSRLLGLAVAAGILCRALRRQRLSSAAGCSPRTGDTTDEPLLNQRGARLIGRTAVLEQPIAKGAAGSGSTIRPGPSTDRTCPPAPASR